MFLCTSGNTVDKVMIHNTRSIADVDIQWSWVSVMLVVPYRGLCDACTKNGTGSLITGCPLLLQLWVAERFAIARPMVLHTAYPDNFYRQSPEDHPTMGALWCCSEVCDFMLFNLTFLVMMNEKLYIYHFYRVAETLRASTNQTELPVLRA